MTTKGPAFEKVYTPMFSLNKFPHTGNYALGIDIGLTTGVSILKDTQGDKKFFPMYTFTVFHAYWVENLKPLIDLFEALDPVLYVVEYPQMGVSGRDDLTTIGFRWRKLLETYSPRKVVAVRPAQWKIQPLQDRQVYPLWRTHPLSRHEFDATRMVWWVVEYSKIKY